MKWHIFKEIRVVCFYGLNAMSLILYYREGHVDIVRYLLEKCECDVNARTRDGNTPLLYACL